MIRTIIVILDFVFLAVISIVAYPVALLTGIFSKRKKDEYCLGFVKFSMKTLLFTAGTKVDYRGLENLPRKGQAAAYIGNHRGFFDVVAAYAVMPDLTGFIAKREMRRWPLIGWWMRTTHCLFMDRENRREGLKTIIDGVNNLKSGISMVIYPEGTRSKEEGRMLEFHSGSFKLATKAKVPIIPIAANNSSAVFEDNKRIRRARIIIEFCEPVETADLSKEEIKQLPDRVRAILQKKITENGKELGTLPEDFEP